ncbi:glycoside hydrolase family 9 protein [Mucilaginibacter sp. UR6-1]|uniref:glycoside hydrolase family 9 protein n=1 Tax=Mucilaginibacter sp. UR6-1 TaxID=1435643 RepID=UPI001E3B1216|nr:glycoside hydrolase family 9 protein [Mucilaginibacter sp. UR6-1]MCC8407530.1 glycoside hydrolase family 9 protein [Mucilaginibacter sp. UR6-1]
MKIRAIMISLLLASVCHAQSNIYINQVGFNSKGPKLALVASASPVGNNAAFSIINSSNQNIYNGTLGSQQQIEEWMPGKYFYPADFSSLKTTGSCRLVFKGDTSDVFTIGDNQLAALTLPAMLNYYHKQRANTPQELGADEHVQLFGSNKRVDLRGGWCDASGDVSKYFSHLAYANFMSPQQIPLVTWSMLNTCETLPGMLDQLHIRDSLEHEALYGADYVYRSLSKEGYFYMTLFSYFKKDPNERRVVGLLANSVTTDQYQCAFREGGGMGIAALARAARWKKHGEYTQAQYLTAAKRAFAHLLINNKKYCDDGNENIIDDYCALMAATELWITTHNAQYQTEARKRAKKLNSRLTSAGYFIADDGTRPYWHASDAGLPVIALCRYIATETDEELKLSATQTVKKHLLYLLKVSNNGANPFGYARQTVRVNNVIKDSYFIPHENETGWWWQGENARLASLATAALTGSKIAFNNDEHTQKKLKAFATQQINWILGCNPYQTCFMYKFGRNNVPYMQSSFGHGSERGGISNGITGKDGNADGSGIDFKREAGGNEWRWTEQWIPHAAWFMQAIAALSAQ